MANKQLGEKLKSLRIKNGLTQKNVYEQLKISQSTFSSWEIGKSEPDAMTFLKLCRIYNVEDILLEFTGKSLVSKQDIGVKLYNNLNSDDKAEIRGEMKQMLKSSKYQDKPTIQSDLQDELNSETVLNGFINTKSS